VKFIRREIDEIVRYLPDNKKNFACLSNSCYCVDRVQNLPGPAVNNVLTVLQISSKSVYFLTYLLTFGGVIAECVNTVRFFAR